MKSIKKPKRIKRVFSTSAQVFHLWANQSQSDARCSSSSSDWGRGGPVTRAFFQGRSCYSYGTHYEAGRIVTYRGVTVGLVNADKRSNTTTKHTSEAYSALQGLMPRLYAADFSNVRGALLDRQGELVDQLMDIFRQRSFWNGYTFTRRDNYWFEALTEFNETAKALKHPELTIDVPDEFIDLMNAHVKRCLARAEELKGPEATAKREAARAKRAAAELVKAAETIQAWRAGYHYERSVITRLDPQLLRVIGNTVQTSKGAEVSLNEAKQLLQRIEAGLVKAGEAVGSFTYKNEANGIVTIGCHRIALSEARAVLGAAVPMQYVQGGKQ